MPRVWPGGRHGSTAGQQQQHKNGLAPKKRRFFSATHLPPLPIPHAPTPPRSITSDRVLAALQTDEKAVVAAKNFVKEKMGDDKWDHVDAKRVTRNAATTTSNGTPPTKRHASATASVTATPTPTPTLTPAPEPAPTTSTSKSKTSTSTQASPRKAPAAKVLPKRLAIGSATQSIAQRIKAKGAQVARKVTLRSAAPPKPPPPPPVASSSKLPPPLPANHARLRQLIASESRSGSVSNAPASGSGSTNMAIDNDEDKLMQVDDTQTPYEANPGKRKEFLESGLYCQDEDPPEERMLVNRVLDYRTAQQPKKRGPGRPRRSSASTATVTLPPIPTPEGQPVSFPPLPLEFHYDVYFGREEREFQLPYNIMWESETGALDGKKRPPFYQKIRTNHFVERSKFQVYGDRAVCNCDSNYGCRDNCINFIMSYLCGTECPCGDHCGNKSLARRKGKATKVVWTGSRGFGLFAAEDIAEGDFVADYRGEVIHINTFIERINSTYQGKRNFYALAYDRDEVIDAGLRGNDTRFINHGCNPNLEVRKYGTLGDGYDEYEVGMWAKTDIKAGEELFYNYNFDSFAVMVNKEDGRQRCMCGAPNCVGFLGRKQGEKSAKELAADISAAATATAAARKGKDKRASSLDTRRASTGTPTSSAPTPSSAPAALGSPQPSGSTLRGRARNVPPPPVPAPPQVATPQPAKRPVGRPRKHPLIDSGMGPPPPSTPLTRPSASPGGTDPRGGSGRAVRPASSVTATPVAATAPAPSASPEVKPVGKPAATPSGSTTATGPEVPVKRGRGRPPKPKVLLPEGVKRPRGRPRLHPLPDPNVPVIKRPRGRPRRQSGPESSPLASTSSLPAASISPETPLAPLPNVSAAGPARRSSPRSERPGPYIIPKSRYVSKGFRFHTVREAIGTAAQTASSSVGSLKLKFTMPGINGASSSESAPAPASADDTETEEQKAESRRKSTAKQVEKSRRNGAPAGWAYVAVGAAPPPPAEEPTSDRAARLAARRGE